MNSEGLPKKVLHIELGRHRFGGTMQAYYLTESLHKAGIENLVVTPRHSPLHKLLEDANVRTFPVRYFGDTDVSLIPKLIFCIRKFQPDIIHIHSRRGADTLGLLAAKLAGIGKIIVARRVDDPLPASLGTRCRYLYWPDHVIAVSKGIRAALVDAGIPEHAISQVYSSIRFEDYQVQAEKAEVALDLGIKQTRVVAVIGQLIRRKGHRYLLQAAPKILQKHADTAFLFLGEGKEEDNLRQQIHSLGLDDKVYLAGYRNDVGRILNIVDVLVHPATMEGFANVAMQAMAAEVPVVSSAVGGMPESVLDRQTGILVEPERPDQISDAVIRLLDSADLRARLGQRGRQWVEAEFRVARMVERTVEVYKTILKSH